jgi:hypothetical protein
VPALRSKLGDYEIPAHTLDNVSFVVGTPNLTFTRIASIQEATRIMNRLKLLADEQSIRYEAVDSMGIHVAGVCRILKGQACNNNATKNGRKLANQKASAIDGCLGKRSQTGCKAQHIEKEFHTQKTFTGWASVLSNDSMMRSPSQQLFTLRISSCSS